MKKHEVAIGGVNACYWEMGRGDETIVFVHGFRGNHKGLLDMAEHFEGYRVILPDLPGYGESDPLTTKHDFKDYALWLDAFLKKVTPGKVIMVSHSFGASIALVYTAKYPGRVSKQVLISPVIASNRFVAKLGEAYYRVAVRLPDSLRHHWLRSRLIDFLSGMLLIKTVNLHRKFELIARGAKNLREIRDSVVLESFLSFYTTNFVRAAKKITVPSLIIAGEADDIAPLDTQITLNQLIPRCELFVIKKVGHLSPLEQPGHVANLVKKYLASA